MLNRISNIIKLYLIIVAWELNLISMQMYIQKEKKISLSTLWVENKNVLQIVAYAFEGGKKHYPEI